MQKEKILIYIQVQYGMSIFALKDVFWNIMDSAHTKNGYQIDNQMQGEYFAIQEKLSRIIIVVAIVPFWWSAFLSSYPITNFAKNSQNCVYSLIFLLCRWLNPLFLLS